MGKTRLLREIGLDAQLTSASRCSSACRAAASSSPPIAVIGVAFCYAASVLYAGRTVRGMPPLQVSLGQLACAAVLMAPFGLAQLPDDDAAREGVARRGRARRARLGDRLLLYFAIIASAGASRAILVTYLVPAFALVYGAVFLDEAVTAVRARRARARAHGHRPCDGPRRGAGG